MSKPRVKLREVSGEEATAVRKLAHARTAPKQLVQRAQVIEALLDDPTLTASEAGCRSGFGSSASGPLWVKRFNEAGVAGLEDKPRAGAPVTHTETVHSQVIALALQKPHALGYPFALWTLERLQVAMQERHGVHLARSTIWAWLEAEGLEWQRQQSWFQDPEQHDAEFVEKGAIVWAYLNPRPDLRVICIDELGPLAVKTYPGATWQTGEQRAGFTPDYGRRGTLWVHGAFEPATGQASLVLSDKRDGASHLQLLEQIMGDFPAKRWLLIEDNLSIHHSRDVKTALLAWPEIQVQFLPKYACWLNLIEPWWKQLRALALKGRRFETVDELSHSIRAALTYWNEHKHPYTWKKLPQQQPQLLLGGFASSPKIAIL